jgi:hypothetical protein
MPLLDGEDRAALRRRYFEAWRKHRCGEPLEPLEDQIVTVLEEHPEYQTVVEDAADSLSRDYRPEHGRSNPFLHMGLHLAIREQVLTDRPRGIASVHAELSRQLGDRHAAEHRMIECLGAALWESQRLNRPPDDSSYLDSLRRLVGARK